MKGKYTPGIWYCEPPGEGGRVIANDGMKTIVHIPPCSPFNDSAIADARLIAESKNLLRIAMDFHGTEGEWGEDWLNEIAKECGKIIDRIEKP